MPEENKEQEINNMAISQEDESAHVFHGLDKSRKIAVAVLAGFTVLVVLVGFFNIKQGIYSPFQRNYALTPENTGNSALSEYCPSGNCRDLNADDLKNIDTDGDGLSDYDELYIYKTSPYLEDSDSDGFSDYEEVMNGKDPNCPAGHECAGDVLFNEYANQVNSGEANNIDPEITDTGNIGSGDGELGFDPEALAEIDAPTLRLLLIEAGIDEAMLNEVEDEELLEMFQESLNEVK